MKNYSSYLILVSLVFLTIACTKTGLNRKESELVMSKGAYELMELFVIGHTSDSILLREKARPFSKKDITSESVMHLKKRILATVKNPENLGVGIAAPQVGVSAQMIYVQRLDKEGEPFEIYFNPEIVEFGDSMKVGVEGCLSVPGYRGKVKRSQNIVLNFLDSLGVQQSEKINGFTAVIFQHEIDHINGTLYFDHVNDGFEGLELETN